MSEPLGIGAAVRRRKGESTGELIRRFREKSPAHLVASEYMLKSRFFKNRERKQLESRLKGNGPKYDEYGNLEKLRQIS